MNVAPVAVALWLASFVAFEPASDPGTTVWAKAGARSHLTCASEDEAAMLAAVRWQGRAQELPDGHQWAERASDCPHAPQVLRLAAMHELSRLFRLPARVDEVELEPLRVAMQESRVRAIAWLKRSLEEQARRGLRPAKATRYYMALAYLGLDETGTALDVLETAEAAGEVDRPDASRLAALGHMMEGELSAALSDAYDAVLHTRGTNELAALYVYALVLDRAGQPSASTKILQTVRTRDRDSTALFSLLVTLPLHERLYLTALDREANAAVPNEALRLWAAYLRLDAPTDAERKLAERHRAQLLPPPGKI